MLTTENILLNGSYLWKNRGFASSPSLGLKNQAFSKHLGGDYTYLELQGTKSASSFTVVCLAPEQGLGGPDTFKMSNGLLYYFALQ